MSRSNSVPSDSAASSATTSAASSRQTSRTTSPQQQSPRRQHSVLPSLGVLDAHELAKRLSTVEGREFTTKVHNELRQASKEDRDIKRKTSERPTSEKGIHTEPKGVPAGRSGGEPLQTSQRQELNQPTDAVERSRFVSVKSQGVISKKKHAPPSPIVIPKEDGENMTGFQLCTKHTRRDQQCTSVVKYLFPLLHERSPVT